MNPLELPDGWEQVSLGDIAELVTSGATPKVGNTELYSDETSGIPFFRIQNVGVNHLILSDLKYVTREVHEGDLKRSQLHPNDVLITITGRLGTSAVVPPGISSGNINQHICLVRLRHNVADPYYISFHLNSEETHREIMSKQHGTTRIALSHRTVSSLSISLPPLEVQRRIASILKRTHGLGESRKQANRLTNRIVQSVFLRMFGDPLENPFKFPVTSLGSLAIMSRYGPRFYNQPYSAIGVPILRTTDITEEGELSLENAPKLEVTPKVIEKYRLRVGDVVISRSGSLGRCAVYDLEGVKCIPGAFLLHFRFGENVLAHYIKHFALSRSIQTTIQNMARFVAQPNVNVEELKSLKVPVPPIDLQRKFVETAFRFARLKQTQIESLQEINELFRSLMDKAFKGKLVKQPNA